MKLVISDTYKLMSSKAAEEVIHLIQSFDKPVICPASGDSPSALYELLTKESSSTKSIISQCYFVGLDEWAGMNESTEGSCRFHLNNQLFHPLNIAENQIYFFDGKAKNLNVECNRIEDFIYKSGGIDLAIVGLGMNGHVGMNEPGTSPALRAHVTKITASTQQSGQKYFNEKTVLPMGITLGIANLMEARHVMLIVNGKKKAEIIKRVLEEEISEELPASFLRNHKNFSVYLDKEAASLLTEN
ncbi:MAG: glucosamine-6-phosphate deaminase [Ginsengibacter sp.]